MQRIDLAPDYEISRVIRGGWQLAGGHGAVDERRRGRRHDRLRRCRHHHLRLRRHLYRRRGADRRASACATANCAGAEALARIKVHTKFVPDLDMLPTHHQGLCRGRHRPVAAAAEHGAARPRAVPLVGLCACRAGSRRRGWLDELRQAGKIDKVGGTNFDTDHMLAHGRRRRAAGLACRCSIRCSTRRPAQAHGRRRRRRHGVSLLCYGTVAGGFLSDALARRSRSRQTPLENRSLIKYKLIIDDFGGWDLFQALLRDAARRSPTGTASTSRRSPAPPC